MCAPASPWPAHAAPAFIDEVDGNTGHLWRFYRTVERTDQLTNGKAWIQTFEHVLKNLPRPRRALGISLSEATDPRYTMPSFGAKQRNDAAKAMRDPQATPGLPDGARSGIGTPLRLPSGDDVLIVCNVGPEAPPQLPQKFRETPLQDLAIIVVAAKCPHMGGCLNDGELKDVEDIVAPGAAKGHRAIVRCPWHNMQFDLSTGEGVGNYSALPRYPSRVAHGALYIGVRLGASQAAPAAAGDGAAMAPDACAAVGTGVGAGDADHAVGTMDVDMEAGTAPAAAPAVLAMAEMPPSLAAGMEAALRMRSRSPRLSRHNTVL
mmetsp:Transcript_127260/g.360157  ORF Transcript_127260/g.360157 Transcript_127260/m.360157 type:complete len:320 (+) Transcript_127260:131-1090(+)